MRRLLLKPHGEMVGGLDLDWEKWGGVCIIQKYCGAIVIVIYPFSSSLVDKE